MNPSEWIDAAIDVVASEIGETATSWLALGAAVFALLFGWWFAHRWIKRNGFM